MAVVACLLLVVEPLPAVARVFGGTVDDVLTRPPLLSPTQPETDALRGLQYGNPAEGISLADIPRPDHLGEAQLGYPVDIPPGRLDWHPDVSLQYGSRIANGWLGVGWDLPTPFIAVDTRWGVPRYRPDRESETYLFEGEQLSPTAHRPDQLPREAERVFTKRVEGTYHLIRRHGDRPDTYWWEVHDKLGNKYFYGRTPEPAAEIGVPEAILRDDQGNAYWWGLVEKRDISNNTVTYFYDEVEDTGVGGGQQEGAPKGAEMYLSRINYTGSVDFDDDDDGELPRFGPYNVVFTRDAQIQPYTRRSDVTIDARTGALRVTSQLLRRITVTYTENGTAQDARSYELGYERGPFDKTLLRSVGQADANGQVFATHTFEYHNDVQHNGQYDGFDATRQWAVGDGSDDVGEELGGVGPTALGSTTSSSGDGRVYLGFNPINPDKGLSIGGGLALDGSDGESEIELIDINGDNLPDKVWKDGGVRYRLNETRPGEAPSFGPSRGLPSLPGLPEDSSFGVSVGPEAYFTVGDIMFHHGWQFNTGTSYFSDVNSDGLVDFVDGGTVYFNHLENGAPVFETHSGNTAVPISDDGISPAIGPDDDHLEEAAKSSFPLQDTLRRWVAPWSGSVTVEGPITLRGESLDGVRVAIQHNGGELWRETIPRGGTAPLMPSLQLNVQKGDRIYFRLMSVHDGAGDNVDWDPVITYANDEEVPRLDVNGKDVHRYVASQDFTLGGRTGIVTSMPYDGRVRVEGKVRKLRATTDDVAVVAEVNGTRVGSPQVIPAAAAGDFPVALEFNVAGPRTSPSPCSNDSPCVDQLALRLAVDSPIDLTALSWTDTTGTSGPHLYYLNASRNGRAIPAQDPNGKPIIEMRPPYDIDVYPESTLGGPQGSWTPDDGDDNKTETYEVDVDARAFASALDASLLPATVMFTVKTRNGLVKKQPLVLNPPPPNPLPNVPPIFASADVSFTATEGVEYWFDFTVREPRLGPLVSTSVDGAGPSARHWPRLLLNDDAADAFPQPYRGWGFAGYNGDGDRAGAAVPESSLVLRKSDFPQDESEKPTGFDQPGYKDPIKGKSYPYAPKPVLNRWEGPKSTAPTDDQDPTPRQNIRGGTWGSAGGASASRLGPDSLGAPGSGTETGRAPQLEGRAEQNSFGASVAVGLGAGAGVSWGYSRSAVDFVDLNGDGYPDVVGHQANGDGQLRETAVQYTTQVGGLDPDLGDLGESDVRMERQYSASLQGSGATPKIKGSASGEGSGDSGGEDSTEDSESDDASGSSAGVNLGFAGGLGHAEANKTTGLNEALIWDPDTPVETDLADLNGDGLPDKVRVEGGDIHVAWNLGYRFTSDTTFPGGSLEESQSDNASAGVTAGFNAGRFDFSAGATLQRDEDHTDVTWADLNGDGLVDRIQSRVSGVAFPDELLEGFKVERQGVEVRFNTGAGLTAPTSFGDFQDDEVARTESFGAGGGADFTIGIGPLCWVVKLCFIILNPGGHGERTVSAQRLGLVDVNGDGLPDSVTSSAHDELNVSENRTGRTNLLKAIHRPLGADITLDYERDGNTVDQPLSIWVLKQVTVFDGHEGDGVDTTVTRWDYDDTNLYDYAEREMYGYGTIVERHLEGSNVLRSYERTYRNTNYYERGLLATETLVDGAGVAFTSTRNTYNPVDAVTGADVDVESTVASVFPGLVKVEQRWHDAGGAVAKTTETSTTFDLRGNPVRVADAGEPGPADDAVAETTFTKCDPHPSFPWTQVPQELRILDGGGNVLRRRVGDTPCDYAAIVALDEHLTPGGDGQRAHTEVGYVDPGGQVGPVIGPANHRGQTDDVTYAYDPVTGYLVNVKDAHGLETKATWNNKFGRLASVTDANGATTSYEYDDRGRLVSMTGPLQQGGPATATFDYHAEDPDPWVLAANFDPANPGNRIDTVRFIDGVEKEIQRKHDATVFDGPAAPARDVMVVSGSTYFDALWRPVRQFYPITEPLGTPGVYNSTDDTAALPTVTTYDVRDRPTKVVAPGDRVTTTTYGYENGPFASVMFAEDVVDPENKRTRRYLDARENVVGVERFRGPAQTETLSLTRFRYDAIQQLLEIRDPGNALTRITYDLLGRQTAVDGPDTGLVEMGYDLAGNQTSRVTPNLRADRQAITYEFDVTRLVNVNYPDDRSNDVVFRYGGPDDEAAVRANAVGRIATAVDGSRIQNRTYDKAGNLVEQRDVMKVKNLNRATEPRHTYATKFVRDHWGRILNMTYPDGEVVTSAYDSGGLVRSVAGVKGPHRYAYVDRMEYDKFGSRRFAAYGNGVVTADDYDVRTLWLSNQVVTRQGAELQDLRYTYDKVGNVTERLDDIPVPPASEKGGPSKQTFGYDDLYRLTSASGTYSFAPDKRRDYSLALSYDPAGRVASKKQTDTTFQSSGSSTPGKDTTYELAYEYSDDRPHAPTRAGSRTLSWDANGNNTGWQEDQGGQRRTITWDEENRAASISDQGNTTEYRYGHDGTLGVERGPLGEVEYVNPWYTALNGGVAWKDVFADDLRVATKRVLDGPEEHQRYFLTGDLIGSVNLVTDAGGKLFEHLEYFPGGEIWVRERSEIYRQPHLYAGMYHDEARTLYRTDARWYEPREALMLSPDPLLVSKPTEAIAEPRLLYDYSYGFDNPVRYIDPVGLSATEAILRFTEGDILVPFKADAQLKARKEFKSKHPIAAKRIGKGTKTLKKVTDFFDDIQSISFDVTVGPKGIKVKKIKIFKIKVFKAKPPPKPAAKKT